MEQNTATEQSREGLFVPSKGTEMTDRQPSTAGTDQICASFSFVFDASN